MCHWTRPGLRLLGCISHHQSGRCPTSICRRRWPRYISVHHDICSFAARSIKSGSCGSIPTSNSTSSPPLGVPGTDDNQACQDTHPTLQPRPEPRDRSLLRTVQQVDQQARFTLAFSAVRGPWLALLQHTMQHMPFSTKKVVPASGSTMGIAALLSLNPLEAQHGLDQDRFRKAVGTRRSPAELPVLEALQQNTERLSWFRPSGWS